MRQAFFLSCSLSLIYFPIQNHQHKNYPQTAVTYDYAQGRFGDQLLAYLHAKWVSFKFEIPLLYKPFLYSDQLVLHTQEQMLTRTFNNKFKQKIVFQYDTKINIFDKKKSTLYVIPYFPENISECLHKTNWPYAKVDWNDAEFKKTIKTLIQPRYHTFCLSLPQNKITVAVHVRKGGSFEKLNLEFPLKFPDDSYYIEQIKKIDDFLEHTPLYVFIFTDDQNPLQITSYYQTVINRPHIQFDCRKTKNDHNLHVLEDFFSLTKFDCLVRPDSNFSICASKLADYLIHISPKNYRISNNYSLITATECITHEDLIKKRLLQIAQSKYGNL